jgi:uncharacterized protein (DUF983 family)
MDARPRGRRAAARLRAIALLRCPLCLQGRLFRSLLGMNKECPVCGTVFEREHGYWLNSMFIAYAAGFLVLIPSAVLLGMRNVSAGLFSAVIIGETIVVWPFIFRYSRGLWLHIDQMIDPRPAPSLTTAAGKEEPARGD